MKPFLQFLKEDLSPETQAVLAPYDNFPPDQHLPQEKELYDEIEFLDFPHYMKTQISVVSRFIASEGIGDDPEALQKALGDAFMKPEIQQAFRLHYAIKFPQKVQER